MSLACIQQLLHRVENTWGAMFLSLQRENASLTHHVTRALLLEGRGGGNEQRDLVVHTEFIEAFEVAEQVSREEALVGGGEKIRLGEIRHKNIFFL